MLLRRVIADGEVSQDNGDISNMGVAKVTIIRDIGVFMGCL